MSIENDIYLHFVTSVITPLSTAIDTGNAAPVRVRITLKKMKDLIADLELKCDSSTHVVSEEIKETLPSPASPEIDGKPTGGIVVSPLDQWLLLVKGYAPRQRSIAREIEILRTFEEARGAVMLKQLHGRLIALGLSEQGAQAAIVTQISRLKKLGLQGIEWVILGDHSGGKACG